MVNTVRKILVLVLLYEIFRILISSHLLELSHLKVQELSLDQITLVLYSLHRLCKLGHCHRLPISSTDEFGSYCELACKSSTHKQITSQNRIIFTTSSTGFAFAACSVSLSAICFPTTTACSIYPTSYTSPIHTTTAPSTHNP